MTLLLKTTIFVFHFYRATNSTDLFGQSVDCQVRASLIYLRNRPAIETFLKDYLLVIKMSIISASAVPFIGSCLARSSRAALDCTLSRFLIHMGPPMAQSSKKWAVSFISRGHVLRLCGGFQLDFLIIIIIIIIIITFILARSLALSFHHLRLTVLRFCFALLSSFLAAVVQTLYCQQAVWASTMHMADVLLWYKMDTACSIVSRNIGRNAIYLVSIYHYLYLSICLSIYLDMQAGRQIDRSGWMDANGLDR